MAFDPCEYGSRIWTTKNGSRIPFATMSIDHLANLYHMLRRNTEGLYSQAAAARVLGRAKEAKKIMRAYENNKARVDELKQYVEWRVVNDVPRMPATHINRSDT